MIEVRKQSVGPWPMNSYVLISTISGDSVLIDPGADPEALSLLLVDTTPRAIWLTHTHGDHIGALAAMKAALAVPVMAHGSPWLEEATGIVPDVYLRGGDTVSVGPEQLHVHYAPGHIEDQLCFTTDDGLVAMVGDTLFTGGPGKTWSAEGFQATRRTLRDVVLAWPDDIVCHPGHGDSFRLGDLRPQIEAFLIQDFGNFYGDATWDMVPDGEDIQIEL